MSSVVASIVTYREGRRLAKSETHRRTQIVKKFIVTSIFFAFASGAVPASADHWNRYAEIQARLAESQQRHASYLPRRYQTSNVIDAAAGFNKGAAWIVRSKNGIEGRIMTNVPTAGDPYTLWVIVFNNPAACNVVCADADIGNPDAHASIFNGGGAISAGNGNEGGVVNFDFDIVAGNLPNDLFVLIGEGSGLRRNHGYAAQVTLVIDQHPSPGTDSWINDLTTTNFPGAGPATNNAVGVFLPCPDESCPDSVL